MRLRRAPARAGSASVRSSSCGWFGHHLPRLRTQCNGELVGSWQLFEVTQRKVFEEDRRGAVQQRPTQTFPAPHDVDETTLVQRLEHTTHCDTADLLDLGTPDRLSVRDDRQRLERRRGEALGTRGQLRA